VLLWIYSKKTVGRKGKGNGRKKNKRRKEAGEWEERESTSLEERSAEQGKKCGTIIGACGAHPCTIDRKSSFGSSHPAPDTIRPSLIELHPAPALEL